METPERARLDAFFRRITAQFPAGQAITTLVITHLLQERPAVLRAMTAVSTIGAVLPKPRSIHQPTLDTVRRTLPVHDLSRERFTDETQALHYLEDTAGGQDVVLVDIGGYFCSQPRHPRGQILRPHPRRRRGHRERTPAVRGPRLAPMPGRVRGPLTAQGLRGPPRRPVHRVLYQTPSSAPAGDILTSRTACIIGFGKISRSIAQTLRAQDLRVTVYDNDAVKRVQAHALGFHTSASTTGPSTTRISSCAPPAISPSGTRDSPPCSNGAYLRSVTSSEDEARTRQPRRPLRTSTRRTPVDPV